MVTPSENDDALILRMDLLRSQSNASQEHRIDNQLTRNLIWTFIDANEMSPTFPKLSLDDIRTLTLGNPETVIL